MRSMLSTAADLTPGFWSKAMAIEVHLINRSPRRVLDKEQLAKTVWFGKQPSYKKSSNSLDAKLIVTFQRNPRLSLNQRVRSASSQAIEIQARWVTDCGTLSLEKQSILAVIFTSMRPSFMLNLKRWKRSKEFCLMKMDLSLAKQVNVPNRIHVPEREPPVVLERQQQVREEQPTMVRISKKIS